MILSRRILRITGIYLMAALVLHLGSHASELPPATYAVLLEATVQETPSPQITLSWPKGANDTLSQFTIHRKGRSSPSWGNNPLSGIIANGNKWQYSDSVAVGEAYEYRVIKTGIDPNKPARVAYGYIFAGLNADQTTNMANRGKLILIVDKSLSDNADIRTKLERYQRDVIGDGWQVIVVDAHWSEANGVNNNGVVVGFSGTSSTMAPFIWQEGMTGGTPVNLNNFKPTSMSVTLNNAEAINDKGQIVGTCTDSSGQYHGFILTIP